MSELRPYYSTRQVIDVDTFLEERGTYYLMCVSKAQLHALRVMAKTRLKWPTTWAKERYEQVYLLPDAADWDEIDAHISEFIQASEVVDMCNNALLSALEGIATAVRLSSCCYSGGPGLIEDDGDFYYGSETPLDEPTAFGPGEEFASEAEYDDHRCEVANLIVKGLVASLNNISLLSLVNLTAASVLAGIVGLGLIAVPPVTAIIAVVALGLGFVFFSELAEEIETNKSDIVCLIYSATGATDAYDSVKAYLSDVALDIGALEVQLGPIADLLMQMIPIDTFNKAYTSVGLPSIVGSDVDCVSDCEDCPSYEVLWGTYNPTTKMAISVLNNGQHVYHMRFRHNGSTYCGDTVTLTSLSCQTGCPIQNYGGVAYRLYDQSNGLLYSSNTPPSMPFSGVAYIAMVSDPTSAPNDGVQFSVQTEWEE